MRLLVDIDHDEGKADILRCVPLEAKLRTEARRLEIAPGPPGTSQLVATFHDAAGEVLHQAAWPGRCFSFVDRLDPTDGALRGGLVVQKRDTRDLHLPRPQDAAFLKLLRRDSLLQHGDRSGVGWRSAAATS
jgi:hypothetical protein